MQVKGDKNGSVAHCFWAFGKNSHQFLPLLEQEFFYWFSKQDFITYFRHCWRCSNNNALARTSVRTWIISDLLIRGRHSSHATRQQPYLFTTLLFTHATHCSIQDSAMPGSLSLSHELVARSRSTLTSVVMRHGVATTTWGQCANPLACPSDSNWARNYI